MKNKSWIASGIILVLVLAFFFRFEIFYGYSTIDNHSYRTNRITGEAETFDSTRMIWLSQKDMINDQINELQRRINELLEAEEKAIAKKIEIENSQGEDEPKGLFEQMSGDVTDYYQTVIESLKSEIRVLERELENL